MNLLHRIFLAPAVAVFFMLLLGGVSYQSLGKLRQATDELKAGVLNILTRSYRALIWTDKIDAKRLEGDAKSLTIEAEKLQRVFDKWVQEPGFLVLEKLQGKQILAELAKYKKAVATALDLPSIDIKAGVSGMQSAEKLFQNLSAMSLELVKAEEQLNKVASENAASSYRQSVSVSIITLLAALILTTAIGVVFSRGIVARIAQATSLAGRIAEGELNSKNQYSNQRNEVGVLLDALHRMQDSLRDELNKLAGFVAPKKRVSACIGGG